MNKKLISKLLYKSLLICFGLGSSISNGQGINDYPIKLEGNSL
jgi:hypothetical protein